MILILSAGITQEELAQLRSRLESLGIEVHHAAGAERSVFSLEGDEELLR